MDYTILADANIWIDHFRSPSPEFKRLLLNESIVIHPYVIGELACGSLHKRKSLITNLHKIPKTHTASLADTMNLIEHHKLFSKGIGLVDAMLLASTLITPNTKIWTSDKSLAQIAKSLKILHTPN